jgi:hypothetical protein
MELVIYCYQKLFEIEKTFIHFFLKNTSGEKMIEEREKNQSLFFLVDGKAPLDYRSMAENKVTERNLNFNHLTSRHSRRSNTHWHFGRF